MIFISKEELEKEIELQRLEREKIENPLIKTKKRTYKKRVYKQRSPYKMNEIKIDKRINSDVKNLLLELLRNNGPMTRKELMDLTKLPWTTLFDNLEKLLRKNAIIKYPNHSRKRGRPKIMWGVE